VRPLDGLLAKGSLQMRGTILRHRNAIRTKAKAVLMLSLRVEDQPDDVDPPMPVGQRAILHDVVDLCADDLIGVGLDDRTVFRHFKHRRHPAFRTAHPCLLRRLKIGLRITRIQHLFIEFAVRVHVKLLCLGVGLKVVWPKTKVFLEHNEKGVPLPTSSKHEGTTTTFSQPHLTNTKTLIKTSNILNIDKKKSVLVGGAA
jgi:hypothetical protein